MKRETEKTIKNAFYKTNPRGGISLIVLVITIIVVIILAAAVIISLQNNNPMIEANKARINSDVANMQAIFTNTVGKVMAEKQDVIKVVEGQLYTTPTGDKKTKGEVTYQIIGEDNTVTLEGKIKFESGKNDETTYYTGKELPLYGSDTKWSVDNQGLLSVKVNGISYGEGVNTDNPPADLKEEIEIVESENPMLQSWVYDATTDFHAEEYKSKITKIKFALADKVPGNRVEEWDVSKGKDKSVMAWVQSDGNEGYILTIAGKSQIIANPNSSYFLTDFSAVKEIENIEKVKDLTVLSLKGCSSLISIDLSKIENSNIKSLSFQNCNMIKELDLSKIDMSKVTGMIFDNCTSLENINFGNLEGCKVTNLRFEGCSKLTSIDLSGIDTSNMTSMSLMFNGCANLVNLNLNSFNTSKVTRMDYMFSGCSSLINLDLSNFDISNINNFSKMFNNCVKLKTLNFPNWNTSNVLSSNNIDAMFYSCQNLSTTLNIMTYFNFSFGSTMFKFSATRDGTKIILNYTENASSCVDEIIRYKGTSNIEKGELIQ